MVRVVHSGLSGPGLSAGQVHCVVFLGKTLYSHSASLHPTGINGISKLSGQPDKNAGEGGGVTCYGLASHPGE